MVPGFELTTFGTRVSSHNHKTCLTFFYTNFSFLTLTAVMKIEFTFNKSVLLMKRQRQAVAQDQIDQLVLHGSRNATNSQCCGSKYVVHGIWIRI